MAIEKSENQQRTQQKTGSRSGKDAQAEALKQEQRASVQYHVDSHTLATAHLYRVRMIIATPRAGQVVRLPVWIPGSYMVREFSRHLQNLCAEQQGEPVSIRQLDKCSWKINCVADSELELRWQVYAFDDSVRTAYLDQYRAFFNPTSLCLMAQGLENKPQVLHLTGTSAKRVATAAQRCKGKPVAGAASYHFADYDALADTPFEVGDFWSGSFTLHGIRHRLVVSGAPDFFDGKRLLRDVKKICAVHLRLWHGKQADAAAEQLQMRSYVFLLHAAADGYGGLEHRDSTALICRREDLPVKGAYLSEGKTEGKTEGKAEGKKSRLPAAYVTLLGLISHEYFHTWNVKRLRPAAFQRYAYFAEQYTELLWFFEGFTSYFDDLALYRAGLITARQYLDLLVRALNHVQQTPGAAVQTVAQSSFDAWVKYYRRDHNTLNHTVSYYVKGALIALCFDLTLRAEERGTLDQLMRALWQHCRGDTMTEKDFLRVLRKSFGRSFAAECEAWVHGTGELPWEALLLKHGVAPKYRKADITERLGVTLEAGNSTALILKTVQHGSAAQRAGLSAGDELLAVNGWRIRTLEQLLPHVTTEATTEATVGKKAKQESGTIPVRVDNEIPITAKDRHAPLALLYVRDGRLHNTALRLPAVGHGNRRLKALELTDAKQAGQWLNGCSDND